MPDAGLKLKDYPDSYPTEQAALEREVIHVTLMKTDEGFGITIVGGDQPGESIQIASIIAGSAADQDGRLKLGDMIITVNGISVLNYSHQMVADLFKGIELGKEAKIEVRRGYPLPDFALGKQLASHSSSPGPGQEAIQERVLVSVVKGDLGFQFSLGKPI